MKVQIKKPPFKVFILVLTAFVGILTYAANHQSQPTTTGDTTFLYPNTTSEKTFQYDDVYATNVFYTIFRSGLAVRVAADSSADTLNATGHGFKNADKVIFTADTAPGGITVGTQYFVISAGGSSFKISTTEGGSAVDITSAGVNAVAHSTDRKIIPQSTNSVTSAIEPSFSGSGVSAWALQNGDVGKANVSVTYRASTALTNTVTFKLMRSTDGVRFGTGADDLFSFGVQPGTTVTTTTTNVPAAFMQGTKLIRLYQIVVGANGVGTGNLAITGMSVNGFVP